QGRTRGCLGGPLLRHERDRKRLRVRRGPARRGCRQAGRQGPHRGVRRRARPRLPPRPGTDGDLVRRRLVPHQRHRPAVRRRQTDGPRPDRRHDQHRWGEGPRTPRGGRADPAGRCGGGVRGRSARPGVGAARGRRRRTRELGSPTVRGPAARRGEGRPRPHRRAQADPDARRTAVDRPRQGGPECRTPPSARPRRSSRRRCRKIGGMATVAEWIEGARPRTLPNAIAPVLVGVGAAAQLDAVSWWRSLLALLVAVALIIGVNYANDYSDGVRGTDNERVGPLRLVGSGAASAKAVLGAALGLFLLAALFGLVLVLASGQWGLRSE